MKARRFVVLTALALALAPVAAACSSGGSSPSPAAGTGPTGATGGQSISIQGLAFHPNTLTVSSGTTQIAVTNHDTVSHTFTLDDGSVDTPIPAGQTVTVTVDISATTGFHCTIHPSMTGTLNVG